jgi:hypothetical protein
MIRTKLSAMGIAKLRKPGRYAVGQWSAKKIPLGLDTLRSPANARRLSSAYRSRRRRASVKRGL